jgi:hypothetical protein
MLATLTDAPFDDPDWVFETKWDGFAFLLAGMPLWGRNGWGGVAAHHYLRIVRSIMLKGSDLAGLRYDTLALIVLMLLAMKVAVTCFRRRWIDSFHLLRGSDVSIVELRLAPGTAVVMSGVSMLLIDGVLLILGVPEPVVD